MLAVNSSSVQPKVEYTAQSWLPNYKNIEWLDCYSGNIEWLDCNGGPRKWYRCREENRSSTETEKKLMMNKPNLFSLKERQLRGTFSSVTSIIPNTKLSELRANPRTRIDDRSIRERKKKTKI